MLLRDQPGIVGGPGRRIECVGFATPPVVDKYTAAWTESWITSGEPRQEPYKRPSRPP